MLIYFRHNKMDGSNVEHSDSDSGESWTLLDHSPVCIDEAADVPDSPSKHDGYVKCRSNILLADNHQNTIKYLNK